jgi:hypothetical protein
MHLQLKNLNGYVRYIVISSYSEQLTFFPLKIMHKIEYRYQLFTIETLR